MREEYDFSGGVRGKYFGKITANMTREEKLEDALIRLYGICKFMITAETIKDCPALEDQFKARMKAAERVLFEKESNSV